MAGAQGRRWSDARPTLPQECALLIRKWALADALRDLTGIEHDLPGVPTEVDPVPQPCGGFDSLPVAVAAIKDNDMELKHTDERPCELLEPRKVWIHMRRMQRMQRESGGRRGHVSRPLRPMWPRAAAATAAAARARVRASTAATRGRAAASTAAAAARPPPRAYRAAPLALVHVSKPCALTDALAEEWGARIRRHAPFQDLAVKPNPAGAADPAAAVAAEGARVLKLLTQDDALFLLDERGRRATSEGVADLVAAAGGRVSGRGRAVFLIGGPHGHAPAVRARAADSLRLSDLVLNHRVARLVALEALYRAHCILRGDPYHHV